MPDDMLSHCFYGNLLCHEIDKAVFSGQFF